MTDRKYVVREAGNGFLSKVGTGVITAGSVAAAVVAVSPQGAVLESLVYNPEAMPAGNLASASSGSAPVEASGQAAAVSTGGLPPTLEDYLVLGELFRGASSLASGDAPIVELGSIIGQQTGGSVGNLTNSTQYSLSNGTAGSGTQGNVTGSTPTADSGAGGNNSGGGSGNVTGSTPTTDSGNGNSGGNGNVTSPTPGGGEDSYGEDSEDSYGEDSYGEDSYDEDGRGED